MRTKIRIYQEKRSTSLLIYVFPYTPLWDCCFFNSFKPHTIIPKAIIPKKDKNTISSIIHLFLLEFANNIQIRPAITVNNTIIVPNPNNNIRFISNFIIPAKITPPKTNLDMSMQYLPSSPNIICLFVFFSTISQIYVFDLNKQNLFLSILQHSTFFLILHQHSTTVYETRTQRQIYADDHRAGT